MSVKVQQNVPAGAQNGSASAAQGIAQPAEEEEEEEDERAEHATGKLTWVVLEDRHVVVQVHGEDHTTMRPLQSFLLKDPKVVFASCEVADQVGFATVEVRMASTGIVSASAAIIKALMQVAVECRKFGSACADAIPRF